VKIRGNFLNLWNLVFIEVNETISGITEDQFKNLKQVMKTQINTHSSGIETNSKMSVSFENNSYMYAYDDLMKL
jgi:hypothetical protein